MAALYLHQALFANDTPPPTAQPHRNSHGAHDLSLSAATLRNSTSEHSYPTEPLLLGPYASTPAYQDILANQPIYSEANRTSWATGLSLLGDPVTSTERKRHRERLVRRRLRRLRWAKRVLRSVIGEISTLCAKTRGMLTSDLLSGMGRIHHSPLLCRLHYLCRSGPSHCTSGPRHCLRTFVRCDIGARDSSALRSAPGMETSITVVVHAHNCSLQLYSIAAAPWARSC